MKTRSKVISILAVSCALAAYQFRGHPAPYMLFGSAPTLNHDNTACEPGGVVSGVIRNDGNGWYVINDEGHRPKNISSVETSATRVVIHFPFTARKIHTLVVTPDESFAVRGITAGASVSAAEARILLAQPRLFGVNRLSPIWVNTSKFPSSNLWIHGEFDADCEASAGP